MLLYRVGGQKTLSNLDMLARTLPGSFMLSPPCCEPVQAPQNLLLREKAAFQQSPSSFQQEQNLLTAPTLSLHKANLTHQCDQPAKSTD